MNDEFINTPHKTRPCFGVEVKSKYVPAPNNIL